MTCDKPNCEEIYGVTRTVVAARHALIAPDGHVPSAFPGWEGATAYLMLSPGMGAKLSQILIVFEEEHEGERCAKFPSDEHEHAFYVEAGTCSATTKEGTVEIKEGGYLFVPSQHEITLKAEGGTKLTAFRKKFQAVKGLDAPEIIHGLAADVKGEPFLGNPRALLQTLLPEDPRYDMAINIFTYQPGATLPFVETHIMEHGLLMLRGQGVYRLEESYYPVAAGDAIWMAPYCPQWYVSMGDVPSSYLYYKDIHRLP